MSPVSRRGLFHSCRERTKRWVFQGYGKGGNPGNFEFSLKGVHHGYILDTCSSKQQGGLYGTEKAG